MHMHLHTYIHIHICTSHTHTYIYAYVCKYIIYIYIYICMYFIYFQYTYNCTPHTHTYTCTVHCTQYLPVYNMFDILHVLHIMVVEFFPHVAWDYTTGCTFEQTLEDRRQKFEEERQSDRTVFSSVHRPRCFAAWLRFEIFEMFV